MARLDCPISGCGTTFSSPSEAGILNVLVKHCAERHPEQEVGAAALERARGAIDHARS